MPFAYVEAYKSLRTNLNFLTSSTGARAIVVTSTMPEEAKSNVSVNLALTLAEDGQKCSPGGLQTCASPCCTNT